MNQVRTKRDGIREASLRGEKLRCLMIHFSEDNLTKCFHELDEKKAVGIDRVTKEEYGENLKANIADLVNRLKSMSYRPEPARQVLIPKDNGKTRPLAISTLEDKIVQTMFKKLLDAIYEPVFLDCSYGFRAGRGAHDAVAALHQTMYTGFQWHVIDVDLANFFGEIPHDKLISILGLKIQDERFLRYISRLLKAGVMTDTGYLPSVSGSPQGSICSPVLANIYAHYCIDLWFEGTVKPRLKGQGHLVRYADDMCLCLTDAADVERVQASLQGRLTRFGLRLNLDKTKVIRLDKRLPPKGQASFDFLGFTFAVRRTRRGKQVIKTLTSRKAYRRSLKSVTEWIKRCRNQRKLNQLWFTYRQMIQGHIAYFGVSGNIEHLSRFIYFAVRVFFKWINRRSQKRSVTWSNFELYLSRFPAPKPRVCCRLFYSSLNMNFKEKAHQ